MNDYKSMTLNELRRYVLKNRKDQEAWDEYVSRPRPNAISYPAPKNQEESDAQFRDFLKKHGKTV